MLKIKVYNTDKSGGTEGWINPDHIMQLSEIHESGFAKLILSGNSKGLVDKEGHEKILNYFKPKKWWQLNK